MVLTNNIRLKPWNILRFIIHEINLVAIHKKLLRGFVSLKVYDLLGRKVATLVNEQKPAGTYTLQWNAANMPSGVYFYRLQAGTFTETRKLILMK